MPVVPSSGAISIISLGRSAGSGERLGWAFSFQFVNSERSIVFQEDFNLCCEVQENKDIKKIIESKNNYIDLILFS